MKYQIAIYNRWTQEYLGTVERTCGGTQVFYDIRTAAAWARSANRRAADWRYEVCEHHGAL